MIRIEHLLSFAVVAQEGSVTKAAEKLYRTQPAISAQLRQLTKAFGEPLYVKHPQGIQLTDAGKGLLAHAQAIVRAYEGAKRYANDYTELQTGSLKLVASLTIGVYLLPRLLARFGGNVPNLNIQLNTRYSQLCIESLIRGDSEIAFVELPIGQISNVSTDFIYKEFHSDEILLVANPKHPIVQESHSQENHSFEKAVQDHKIIWAEPGSGTRRAVEIMLKEKNLSFKKHIEITGIEAIKRAVMHNLGIAFLSHLAVKQELEAGQMISLPFSTSPLSRPFTIIHPQWDLCSNSCKTFLKFFESDDLSN